MHDFILEGFGQSFRGVQVAGDESDASRDDIDVDEEGGIPVMGRGRGGGDEELDEMPLQHGDGKGTRLLRMWNIFFGTREETLHQICSQYGEVEKVEYLLDRDTKRFKGAASIWYKKPADAQVAVQKLNNTMIDNRPVFVELQERKGRGSMGSGGR